MNGNPLTLNKIVIRTVTIMNSQNINKIDIFIVKALILIISGYPNSNSEPSDADTYDSDDSEYFTTVYTINQIKRLVVRQLRKSDVPRSEHDQILFCIVSFYLSIEKDYGGVFMLESACAGNLNEFLEMLEKQDNNSSVRFLPTLLVSRICDFIKMIPDSIGNDIVMKSYLLSIHNLLLLTKDSTEILHPVLNDLIRCRELMTSEYYNDLVVLLFRFC